MNKHILGIDLGGTKTSVSLANQHGSITCAERIPTTPAEGIESWLQRTCSLITDVLNNHDISLADIDIIGVSAPGPLSAKTGTLLNPPNLTGWVDMPLVALLEKELGRPVIMNNDANAAALAEWMFGEYSGADGLIYLTMSTGLGGGIIINGNMLQGVTDTAGEVGFHVLDVNGQESPCGHRGSFEAYCGGKNIADQLRHAITTQHIETSILTHANNDPAQIDMRCLLAALKEQDPYALKVWKTFIYRLAQGIGNLITILNPEVILLGTIAIHAGDLLFAPLKKQLPQFTLKPALEACRIAPSSLASNIGDLGAIALGMDWLKKQ